MYYDKSTIITEGFSGRYKVIRPLGTGGMGRVFLVEDRESGRKYAMKVMAADERGMREAEYLEKADAVSGVPKLIRWEKRNHCIFLVMEYVKGKSLKEYMKRKRKPGKWKILWWSILLCEILRKLHGLKPPVICLDLKPEHVRITPGGDIYLIDFGISAYEKEPLSGYGTKGFAAPEQIRENSGADVRMDIYSFGRILAFCRGNRRWKELNPIISKCTAEVPGARYSSMEILGKTLKKAVVRRFGRWAAAAAAGILLSVGLTGGIRQTVPASRQAAGSTKEEIREYLFGGRDCLPDYIMAAQCLEERKETDKETRRYERILNALEHPEKVKSWKQIWKDLRENPRPELYEACFLSKVYLSREKELNSFGNPAEKAWNLTNRYRDHKGLDSRWMKIVNEERFQAAAQLARQGDGTYLYHLAREELDRTASGEEGWSRYRRLVIFVEGEGRDASGYYEAFLQKFPDWEEAYVEYGVYLCRKGRWKEAGEVYRRGEKETGMEGTKARSLKEKLGI